MATSNRKRPRSQRVRVSGNDNVTYTAGGDISINEGSPNVARTDDPVETKHNPLSSHERGARGWSANNLPIQDSFDVFLCHNSEDKPAIKEIAERLKAKGLRPWLDEWALRPGFPWQPLLEEQINKIRSAAVFVGPPGIGPWQRAELDAFLRAFVERRCPVIPVILPGVAQEPNLPVFLKGLTWVDFRQDDPDPLERLIWGITGERRESRAAPTRQDENKT